MKKTTKVQVCREDKVDYKALTHGLSTMSDSELVALIIGEDLPERAREILGLKSNNLADLAAARYDELRSTGVSHARAMALLATGEVARRIRWEGPSMKDQIKNSTHAFKMIYPYIAHLDHEEFWVIYLNRSNKVIKMEKISQGGISGTVTDVRLILRRGIELLASAMVICHNHPSGNREPSESDIKITEKIRDAGGLMDIQLLDHIIVASEVHYSFADNGKL